MISAAYCYHLIHNHPFIDGNKRIGTLAMLTFLKINDTPIDIAHNELYRLAMRITTSKINEKEIAEIMKSYSLSANA